MARGPDPPLEIHVHVVNPPPPRAQLPVWWLLAIPLWPVILAGWLMWLAVTLTLTALGIVVTAGGAVIWGAGWLIALRWPDAGGDVVAVGCGIARGTVHAVDRMNGHGR